MKKKLPITKNKDVVVSWVYTWSKQQDMSIHEQRIVLRILEACQAELKGVKLKDYAGTKRKFEHGLWDVDAQMHVSDVIFSGRDYNEIIAALDSLAGRFLLTKMTRNGGSADLYLTQNIKTHWHYNLSCV